MSGELKSQRRAALAAALLLPVFAPLALADPPARDKPVLSGMVVERVFAGRLMDTVIQRLRDPQTGAVCYLYTPLRVNYERNGEGLVFYGANTIGSISCFPAPEAQIRQGNTK